MKRLFSTLLLMLSVCSFSTAQVQKTNSFFGRANYTTNIYTSIHCERKGHNFSSGFTVDFGGKQFLNKDNGWFLEEAAKFLFTDLPYIRSRGNEKVNGRDDPWRELGVGVNAVGGYEFFLDRKLSLALSSGPELRYIFSYYTPSELWAPCRLHTLNLRWSIGVGLNVNRKTNFSIVFSHDIVDRAYRPRLYSTLQIGFGIGYYF